MGCFGGGDAAAAQREADHLALIARQKSELTSLKSEIASLKSDLVKVRAESSNQVREAQEEAGLARRETLALKGQLACASDKEGEIAEHTVSLIQEIAELKGRIRSGGGGAGGASVAALGGPDSEEITRLRTQLEEAREEARSYSEEIGDLAKQVSDLQARAVDSESYRKEIKSLKKKLRRGGSRSSADDASSSSGGSDVSNLFGFKGDLANGGSRSGASSSANSSAETSPVKSAARGTFSSDGGIQTVSLTSGFFGRSSSNVSDGSIALDSSKISSQSSLRSNRSNRSLFGRSDKSRGSKQSSIITPTSAHQSGVGTIDAEVVSNAIKCVEELIKRVNQSRSKGSSSLSNTPTKDFLVSRGQFGNGSFDNIEVVALPASMKGTFQDDGAASVSTATGRSQRGGTFNEQQEQGEDVATDNSEGNSSFYSAASTKDEADQSSISRSKSGILDTTSWKPVGNTGDLMAVSDEESTIGTMDGGDFLDDSYSAYSAPVLSSAKKMKNDSAVIIADLYRVQNLLSSVLEGRPHVKEQLQSTLMSGQSLK